jgi:hypothetical protein
MAVVVVGGVVKDAIVVAAINHRHSWGRRHRHRWLNPTAATVNNDHYCRRQQSSLPLPHSWQRRPPEASGHYLSMAVIVDGGGSGMEGWWHNGIGDDGIFGQLWWQ